MKLSDVEIVRRERQLGDDAAAAAAASATSPKSFPGQFQASHKACS